MIILILSQKAGDEIVINTTNNNVTINGQNANKAAGLSIALLVIEPSNHVVGSAL